MNKLSWFWFGLAACFALLAFGAFRQRKRLEDTFKKKGGIPSAGFINDKGVAVNTNEEFHKGLVEMCNTELAASLLALAGAIITAFE